MLKQPRSSRAKANKFIKNFIIAKEVVQNNRVLLTRRDTVKSGIVKLFTLLHIQRMDSWDRYQMHGASYFVHCCACFLYLYSTRALRQQRLQQFGIIPCCCRCSTRSDLYGLCKFRFAHFHFSFFADFIYITYKFGTLDRQQDKRWRDTRSYCRICPSDWSLKYDEVRK